MKWCVILQPRYMEEISSAQESVTFPSVRQGKSSKNFKRFFIFLIVLLILGGGVFGATRFLGSETQEKEEEETTPTPTAFIFPTDTPAPTLSPTPAVSPTPSKSPSPTPKPTLNPVDKATGLDRSDLSVEVQNGSGQVGAATKASETLRVFGYNVVKTGNADSFDYENTTILVKSDKNSYLPLLKSDLSATYTIGSSSATLSASSSADALVIVGK